MVHFMPMMKSMVSNDTQNSLISERYFSQVVFVCITRAARFQVKIDAAESYYGKVGIDSSGRVGR